MAKRDFRLSKKNNEQQIGLALLVNQEQFQSIVNIIGRIYLEKVNSDLWQKSVIYGGHAYTTSLSQGDLDMPDTSERDREALREANLKWRVRLKKKRKVH